MWPSEWRYGTALGPARTVNKRRERGKSRAPAFHHGFPSAFVPQRFTRMPSALVIAALVSGLGLTGLEALKLIGPDYRNCWEWSRCACKIRKTTTRSLSRT